MHWNLGSRGENTISRKSPSSGGGGGASPRANSVRMSGANMVREVVVQ